MSPGLASALVESALGEWLLILSFVFGGCCSNVWALEAVLKDHPKSATFLTFSQFIYVAITNLSTLIEFPPKGSRSRWPRFRQRKVPLTRWIVQVLLFLGISLMNNYAFALKIPVTLHIIFRSGGLCVSMLTGWIWAGRRYSIGQVIAGIVITAGIVLATLSTPRNSKGAANTQNHSSNPASMTLTETMEFVGGIGLLSMALLLSACLGLFQEETYRRYGKQWRESLFYSHFLSLPFFIPFTHSLSSTFQSFLASPPLTVMMLPDSIGTLSGSKSRRLVVPSALFALLLNVVTQGMCIRGVNKLTSRVNSTTVNLVLTVRKAVSLAISVWFYGRGFSTGLVTGGAMVLCWYKLTAIDLVGTLLYSFAPAPSSKSIKPLERKQDSEGTSTALSVPETSLTRRTAPSNPGGNEDT